MMGKNFSPRRIALETLILGLIVAVGATLEAILPREAFAVLLRIAVVSAVPAPTLFVAYYLRSHWRDKAIGRALMTTMVTFSIFLWFVLISWITPIPQSIRLVVYSLISYSLWRLFVTLRKTQIRQTRRERAARQETR